MSREAQARAEREHGSAKPQSKREASINAAGVSIDSCLRAVALAFAAAHAGGKNR
jgi:hypothetical protein